MTKKFLKVSYLMEKTDKNEVKGLRITDGSYKIVTRI